MSLQALTWVIYEVGADIKYSDFRVLLILADMANQQGNGAYPSRSTIGRLTGYSVRTVSYALKNLESAGLIRRGDQRIVSGLGGYKPTVWNLNMDRDAKTAPIETNDTAVQTDRTPAVQRGVQKTGDRCANSSAIGLHKNPSKEEPYIEPRESNARARKPTPIPADWKPTEEHQALADRLGIDCHAEADKFRDRALDSGARSADWNAKFRNWLVKGKERGFATPKDSSARRRFTWGSEEVKRVLGPIACEGTDTYVELACKVADLLNQGLDPDMLRRQLADVSDNAWVEQLFEQGEVA